MMEGGGEKRVADYFVLAGLPKDDLMPMEELNGIYDPSLKSTHRLDPIVDLAVINRTLGEVAPVGYKCVEFTPTGFPADLNHGSLLGSLRAAEMYLCYRRGRDKPPLVDIGVLYEVKDRVLPGCEVIYHTLQGRPANVNNTNSSRIYITYRRAEPLASSDTLSVVDICVILLNKGETPPHAYCMINKTLNKGMMGSDVYLCYKKSMTKTYALAYQPAVLSRYPLEDIPGLPLPDRVAMFCLPLGAAVEGWLPGTRYPSPVFSTFILTAASGEKMYGAGITFYEELPSSTLNESQLEQLGAVVVAGEGDAETKAGREVFQNKCICILSRSPYFDTFKRFLAYLCRLVASGPHLLPLERHIVHFLTDVPIPSPQRPKILIQLDTTELTLSHPDETPLPISGASYIEMLKNLGASNCVLLLLCTLMEQKLLIHSLRPAVLTSVAEAVANMIFPFHWQCPYIPLCPLGLSYVLNSPTPFIIGIDSRYFDLYDPPSDVTCVDLDTNSMTGALFCSSEERKSFSLKMLPKKASKVLKTTLERLFDVIWRSPQVYCGVSSCIDDKSDMQDSSRSKIEMQMELAIQEAFLRFMAVVLKGYNNFLLPIIKAPTLVTTDVSSLFDIQGFLKSRDRSYHKFYAQMIRTQAFSRFIEERSFVSDKDTGLTFFDECLEKVEEGRDEPRLIEPEDSQKSDMTVFIMLPEPVGLPAGALYSYKGFPELNPDLYPRVDHSTVAQSLLTKPLISNNSLCPYSPITRRTKHEIKSTQKLAMKHSNVPSMWAKCLVWHCYSLWFIHLPAYVKTVHSKAKALRTAYDVLVKMQSAKLQPPDEVCYRVLMQLCGLYHQPVLAVKVLFAMKKNDVQPNAITYGFYNKAVLESKWPSSSTTAYQRWMKLRHTVLAVAQFKRCLNYAVARRRQSVYSNSESDPDVQSMDSYLDGSGGAAGLSSSSASTGWATSIIRDVAALARGEKPKSGEDKQMSEEEPAGTVSVTTSSELSDKSTPAKISFGSQDSLDTTDRQLRKLHHDESSHTIIQQDDQDTMISSQTSKDVIVESSELEQQQSSHSNNGSQDEHVDTNNRSPSSFCYRSSDTTNEVDNAESNKTTEQQSEANGQTVEAIIDVTNSDSNMESLVVDELSKAKHSDTPMQDISNVTITSDSTIAAMYTVVDGPQLSGANDMADSKLSGGNDAADSRLPGGNITGDSKSSGGNETDGSTQSSGTVIDESRISGGSDADGRLGINRVNSNQSLMSPVHSARITVTENDPLGLFGGGDTARKSGARGVETGGGSLRSSGRGLLKSSSIGAESASSSPSTLSHSSLYADSTIIAPFIASDISSKPPLSVKVSRDSLGSAMKSFSNRFASKYREVKQTISSSTTGVLQRNGSLSSGSVNSLTSVGTEQGSVSSIVDEKREKQDDTNSSRFSSAAGSVENAAVEELKGEDQLSDPVTESSTERSSDSGSTGENKKNHLKVPGLYAPLVSGIWGGIKSIRHNERVKSTLSSIQKISESVKDTLIDSLSDDWLMSQATGQVMVRDPEMEYVWSSVGESEREEQQQHFLPRSESTDSEVPHSQGLDHLVPVEEGSEKGSVSDGAEKMRSLLEQLPTNLMNGSMNSLQPPVQVPMDVEICSMSKCPIQECSYLLYDEEIMSGWTADESNLNTSCPVCCAKLVPLLQIYIKDYRHCVKPVLTNLSQSMESMASIQSTPSVQLGESGGFRRVSANPNPSSATIPEDGLPVSIVSETRTNRNETMNIIQKLDFDSSTADTDNTCAISGSKDELAVTANTNSNTDSLGLSEQEIGCDRKQLERTIGCNDVNSETLNSEVVYQSSQINSSHSLVAESTIVQDSETTLVSTLTEISCDAEQSTLNQLIDADSVNVDQKVCSSSTEETHPLFSTSSNSSRPYNPSESKTSVKMRVQASQNDSKGAALIDMSKRWSSSFLETNAAMLPPKISTYDSKRVNKADSGTGSLESRRSLSECSLNAMSDLATSQRRCRTLCRGLHSSSVGNKLDDESSVVSAGSDGSKGVNGTKKPVELDPINVPYLSPLVLRKEMENVLELDGDACLNRPEFVDEHPILYWNLVWYFKRINVPSHILGFLMTAASINGNAVQSSVWGSGDSRHVMIRSVWDNPRLHNEHGEPMYMSWNLLRRRRKESAVFLNRSSLESLKPAWSESVMQGIVTSIMNNDVQRPLQLILSERGRRKAAAADNVTASFHFYSIYRDILFLSLIALGRENIDIEAFDREFKAMVTDLPPTQLVRMRVADKYPNAATCWCRTLFGDLDL